VSPFGISPTIAYIRKIRWRISFANGRISKKNMRVKNHNQEMCCGIPCEYCTPYQVSYSGLQAAEAPPHPLPKHHYSALESLISERIRPVK